jgi:pimeloyl-ACP methyl ester carboxylesterase
MKVINSLENMRDTPAFGPEKGVVIFVHGEFHGGWCWEEALTGLFANQGYRCITFDLPYHERAGERADIRKARLRDYLLTLQHVVKRVGGEPILVGHSLGAHLIEQYLAKGPCRMAVLMTPPPPDGIWRTALRWIRKPHLWKAVLTRRMRLAVSTPGRAAMALFGEGVTRQQAQRYAGMLGDESPAVLAELLWTKPPADPTGDVPVIVFGAEKDSLFSLKDLERTAARYHCGIVVMSGMGHDMMLEPQTARLADIMINCIETRLRIPRHQRMITPLDRNAREQAERLQEPRQKKRWY